MTEFSAATERQMFGLRHFAGIDALATEDRFAGLDADLVEAIVEGAGQLAADIWAPLDRVGDENPARLVDGKVVMPPGFQEAWHAYVGGGWAGLTVPAEHGGQGMPFSLGLAVAESLGAANFGFALCPMLTQGAVEALDVHGSEAQKALYLPRLASGKWTGTMNLTEPAAGSDVGALRTTATPVGDGRFKIAGQKIFITYGDHELAENIVHLVLARTPNAPAGTKGISLFIVPKYRINADGSPGEYNNIATLKLEHKMGIHASPTCVLQYGEGGDTLGELVGEEFGGMRAMFTMMNNARINVGNQGVQVGERAFQQALAYAADRVQSARAGAESREAVAIIEHPDVRRMLMRMKAGVEAIRALNFYAAGQVDRAALGHEGAKARADLLVPLVKAYSTDLGCEIAGLNVQVHGGMGYIEETGAAQHYRDARIAPIYEGTNGIQAIDLVGRKLSMQGGAVVRDFIAEVAAEAEGEDALAALAGACGEVADWMLAADTVDARLAGAVPFCTMISVLACGWLMLRQERIAHEAGTDAFHAARAAAARFYLDHHVPEALGLKAGAMAGPDLLYALDRDALGA